ncbi:MAG TPA: 50S ribosomal protein L30 [Thermomicrobiales bacterium]|nr:50S ribosomal protein L30 [Thermomicrobiales bacterium]
MSEQTSGQLKITLIRSSIGRPADQGNAAKSLGLRRLHHSVIREDNPSIRGQVNKISHLVTVEEIAAE